MKIIPKADKEGIDLFTDQNAWITSITPEEARTLMMDLQQAIFEWYEITRSKEKLGKAECKL